MTRSLFALREWASDRCPPLSLTPGGIPAPTAKMVVEQLKEHGHVTRGWIGVRIQAVTADIADSLGMKKPEGVIVAEPLAGSPAVKAGIASVT